MAHTLRKTLSSYNKYKKGKSGQFFVVAESSGSMVIEKYFRKQLNRKRRYADKAAIRHGREAERRVNDASWYAW